MNVILFLYLAPGLGCSPLLRARQKSRCHVAYALFCLRDRWALLGGDYEFCSAKKVSEGNKAVISNSYQPCLPSRVHLATWWTRHKRGLRIYAAPLSRRGPISDETIRGIMVIRLSCRAGPQPLPSLPHFVSTLFACILSASPAPTPSQAEYSLMCQPLTPVLCRSLTCLKVAETATNERQSRPGAGIS